MIYISASYQFSGAIFGCTKLIVTQHERHKVLHYVYGIFLEEFS